LAAGSYQIIDMNTEEYILHQGLLAVRVRLLSFARNPDGCRIAVVRVLEGEQCGQILYVSPNSLRLDTWELTPVGAD
jgi:hypothetical protein